MTDIYCSDSPNTHATIYIEINILLLKFYNKNLLKKIIFTYISCNQEEIKKKRSEIQDREETIARLKLVSNMPIELSLAYLINFFIFMFQFNACLLTTIINSIRKQINNIFIKYIFYIDTIVVDFY